MNITQQPVIFSSASNHSQIVMGILIAIPATVLICLVLWAAMKTAGRSLRTRYAQEDYWINRARRKGRLMRQLAQDQC